MGTFELKDLFCCCEKAYWQMFMQKELVKMGVFSLGVLIGIALSVGILVIYSKWYK